MPSPLQGAASHQQLIPVPCGSEQWQQELLPVVYFSRIIAICYFLCIIICLFFFFLLPECLWWLLEVSRNPRPERASWDTYPESLLHPGGSFQLHWTAFQQRPHGPRGRYKTEQAEPRGRARTSSRAVGFCCSFSSWPPQLKGRAFSSVVGAVLSLLKGRQDPSFLVPGDGCSEAPFLEAALRLPAPAGWFPAMCSLLEEYFSVWLLPKRNEEPCSLYPQCKCIWTWCRSCHNFIICCPQGGCSLKSLISLCWFCIPGLL